MDEAQDTWAEDLGQLDEGKVGLRPVQPSPQTDDQKLSLPYPVQPIPRSQADVQAIWKREFQGKRRDLRDFIVSENIYVLTLEQDLNLIF